MMTNKMTPIRYFSHTNDWIDFLVFVPSERTNTAIRKIEEAMDMFLDDYYETFGDAVSQELQHTGVPFTLVQLPWNHELDKPAIPERIWEEWIDGMPECVVLNQFEEVK